MPSKTRTTRSTKASRENISLSSNNEVKKSQKSVKKPRTPLADKTNSASDDNESTDKSKKVVDNSKKLLSKPVAKKGLEINNNGRPRRDRRLPSRFIENPVLNRLSQSKENVSPVKGNLSVNIAFETPEKIHDNSLISARPKRVCRLPSKFDDHSISPNKFVPVQPCFASTPLCESKTKRKINVNVLLEDKNAKTNSLKVNLMKNRDAEQTSNCLKAINKKKPIRKKEIIISQAESKKLEDKQTTTPLCYNISLHKEEPNIVEKSHDSKSAGAQIKPVPTKLLPTRYAKQSSLTKGSPTKRVTSLGKISETKLAKANFSFRLLEEKKNAPNSDNNLDIYEFTFDPNEEPKPQKKKRKRVVKKKPPKPKQVVFKNNYDQNVSQALQNLKQFVKSNKRDCNQGQEKLLKKSTNNQGIENHGQKEAPLNEIVRKTMPELHINAIPSGSGTTTAVIAKNTQNSIQLEEIAADNHASLDHANDINYSPVSSPHVHELVSGMHSQPNDPLNLREELSFFNDQPVASSSMNVSSRSTRLPNASPWRADFENFPIKWHVNSHIKSDMTPAIETSYVNFNDSCKNKHVYTNLVPNNNEPLPEIEKEAPKLKQTSIADFIREVAERSLTKKKRGRSRSITPVRNNTVFENLSVSSETNIHQETPKKLATPIKNSANTYEYVENNIDSDDKENSTGQKRKNNSGSSIPVKISRKDGNIENFFGFDDSGYDQENVIPNERVRSMRSRSRAVLKELNAQSGPTRATLKIKQIPSAVTVENLFEELKSSTDTVTTASNTNNAAAAMINENESQSIHLFEDIETVHHQKAHRKSYSKAKKVTFRVPSSEKNTQDEAENSGSSAGEDDLSDLTFEMPAVKAKRTMKKKKVTAKQKLCKKEEEEAEKWAAGFNSMCEDVDGFDLIVE